jgi:hypothetical protein
MKQKNRRISGAFLILGMVFLVIGISTDKIVYSWSALIFVLLSLILGGRWLKPRR